MRTILVCLCLAFITIFNPAAAKPFSDLITFGGPLEDIGNFASVNGDLPPPFFKNRFSNGPLAVEILATRFGLKVEPSLHRIGPVRGNNFSSVDAFASGDEPQDLAGQLDAYLTPRGNKADPHALYYIIIGGNEVIQATYEPNDATAIQIVTRAVLAKEEAIHRLVDAGAKTILVPNFIDIGITPQIRLAGLSERGAKISKIHNRVFEKMLNRVERGLDFELIRFDFYQFANDVLKNADVLRFTNTTDSCLALLPAGQCDFEHFIFFNELFPTAKVHDLWGNALVLAVIQRESDRCLRRCKSRPSGKCICVSKCHHK